MIKATNFKKTLRVWHNSTPYDVEVEVQHDGDKFIDWIRVEDKDTGKEFEAPHQIFIEVEVEFYDKFEPRLNEYWGEDELETFDEEHDRHLRRLEVGLSW